MSTEVISLTALAQRINEANSKANDSAKKAILYAVECGAALVEAKAQVKHGEFQGWLEANCNVKYRQAAKYMRLSKHWPELSKVHSDSLLDLSIDKNLALIAKPIDAHENLRAIIKQVIDGDVIELCTTVHECKLWIDLADELLRYAVTRRLHAQRMVGQMLADMKKGTHP